MRARQCVKLLLQVSKRGRTVLAAIAPPSKEKVAKRRKSMKAGNRRVSFAPDDQLTMLHHYTKVPPKPPHLLLQALLSTLLRDFMLASAPCLTPTVRQIPHASFACPSLTQHLHGSF